MSVGEVRRILQRFSKKVETVGDTPSTLLSAQLLDLLADLDEETLIAPSLALTLKETMTLFWQQINLQDIAQDWAAQPKITVWLELNKELQAFNLNIPKVHHPYFFRCLLTDYQKQGNEKVPAKNLLTIIVSCARMMGYAGKEELDSYLESYLSKQKLLFSNPRNSYLSVQFAPVINTIFMLFYLFYHHCNEKQLALLPLLIKYRTNTTDEEIRSETALLRALNKNPLECIALLEQFTIYLNHREFYKNNFLAELQHVLPQTVPKLLDLTLHKTWYYACLNSIRLANTDHLFDLLNTLVVNDFNTQKTPSYTQALAFAIDILENSTTFPAPVKSILVSSTYVFCLSQYIKSCVPKTEDRSFFSITTQYNAAMKLKLQEMGISISFKVKEWAATKAGPLGKLVELFNDYKAEHIQILTL